MKLISCDFCGVVLDTNKIFEPETHDHDSQERIPGNSEYDSKTREFMPVIECPCCDMSIFYHNGERP